MIDFTDTQKLINNVEGFLDKEHLRSRLMGKVLQMQYFFYNKYLANKYINSFLVLFFIVNSGFYQFSRNNKS